jgi:hypothetical protein
MRQIIIPELEYDKFEEIVDKLYSTVPFAIISTAYRKKLKKGFIFFWDSDYIPEELQQYITRPKK